MGPCIRIFKRSSEICTGIENSCVRGWEFLSFIFRAVVFHALLGCSTFQKQPWYKNEHMKGDSSHHRETHPCSFAWLNFCMHVKQDVVFPSILQAHSWWDGDYVCPPTQGNFSLVLPLHQGRCCSGEVGRPLSTWLGQSPP